MWSIYLAYANKYFQIVLMKSGPHNCKAPTSFVGSFHWLNGVITCFITHPTKAIPHLNITEQFVAAVVLVSTQTSLNRDLVLVKMALQITVDVH